MSEPLPSRTTWLLPVLFAISASTAVLLGFLFLVRPSAGELGTVRVVVSDDNGKSGNAIRVILADAPLAQNDQAG